MSGSINLSSPYDFQYLQELNAGLAYHGLPNYTFDFNRQCNNVVLPGMQLPMSKKSLIRKLQTIAIELEYNPNWTVGDNSIFVGEPIFPDLVKEVFRNKHTHFIYYLNSYFGAYTPVDFEDFDCQLQRLPLVGSSINLIRELQELTDKLNFDVENYYPNYNEDDDMYFEEDFYDFANNILVEEKFVLLELFTYC